MIPKQDLRIGNEVFYDDETFCTVVGINFGATVELAGCEGFISVTDIEPIPLTEDILGKAGFDMPSKVLMLDDKWFLYQAYDGFHIQIERKGEQEYICERFKIECQYLHQLQNLIYSLTGTELNIQLP